MAIDIVETASCNAPLEVAFAYVADYRNIGDWMFGVERFESVGEKDHGPGSLFEVTIRLGVRLHTTIQAVEWEKNRLIAMDSVKGLKARSRWEFASSGENRTTVTARMSYELPFGPAGTAMGRVMQPFVRQAIAHASKNLVDNVEKAAATS